MSLHAELSPEALARLQAQRRNSTISSMIIAFIGVILVAMLLALMILPQLLEEKPDLVAWHVTASMDEAPQPKTLDTSTRPKPTAPAAMRSQMIVAHTLNPLSIPTPDLPPTESSAIFGAGDDFGDGSDFGPGGDGGGKFGNLPEDLKKRCTAQDRMARLLESGGTAECETAVIKALDWLKATQNPDGSWSAQHPAAMTGLAILAYLGHCETVLSEPYGDTVFNALGYLVNLGMKDGKLSTNTGDKHWPYEHAIATYALAEAATFHRTLAINYPQLAEVTQRAGQFIIDNQNASGGWEYAYEEGGARGGDLSITAWHVQALRACEHSGIDFRNLKRSGNRAIEYVATLQNASGGFGYANADSPAGDTAYFTLTGAGVLAMQMWGKGSNSAVRKGARYMAENTKFDYNSAFADLYGHYYEAQAMMNRGGEQWKAYNALFRDQLLANQNPDGSWKNPGAGSKLRAVAPEFAGNSPMNLHYRTCLNTLMLEVYYRYLPSSAGTGASR